jgi:hypothetical protein
MLEEDLAAAKNPNARRVSGTAIRRAGRRGPKLAGASASSSDHDRVSNMIPFVAAGGLLTRSLPVRRLRRRPDGRHEQHLFDLPEQGLLYYQAP